MRAAFVAALLVLAVVACRPAGAQSVRYLVTAAPLAVGVVPQALCIAVDTRDSAGVWWWEPGRTGCSTRSTGPTVFRAENASVSRGAPSRTWDIHFRLPLIVGPASTDPGFADIRLTLHDDGLESLASGARVSMEPRRTLDIPERP
jgi:hypothetical protein